MIIGALAFGLAAFSWLAFLGHLYAGNVRKAAGWLPAIAISWALVWWISQW